MAEIVSKETVRGTVKSNQAGTSFIATFEVNGTNYTYSAKINVATGPWSVNNATLEYDYARQLTLHRTYDGYFGQYDIMLNLANGPTIRGNLISPLEERANAQGDGNWGAGVDE